MIHIFKHKNGKLNGKFDFAIVVKGRYIAGSVQGYERKRSVYRAIIACADVFNLFYGRAVFQDNTLPSPKVFYLYAKNLLIEETSIKPKKPYQP